MEKAKDRPGARSRMSVKWLLLALASLASGCSGLTGLRSVGTGKPSLLAFWDRPGPGSPSSENDYYAQRMHDSGLPGGAVAQKDKPRRRPASADDGHAAIGSERLADDAATTGQLRGRNSSPAAAAGDSVRVTLGRPEPLPGMLLAGNVRDEPQPSQSALPWKSGAAEREPEAGPALTAPAEEAVEPTSPVTRLAEHETPSPKLDPKTILAQAENRLQSLKTYQVKFSRAERVGGELQPEEDIVLSVQREPKAIRLEWMSGANKGREVIYSSDLDPRMLFVHLPTTAIPLPAMKISVDSPLVMKNSRHAITEAGFETIIANLRSAEGGNDRNQQDGGTLEYQGIEPPPGSNRSAHHFVRRARNGEIWNVYFDTGSFMPSLVEAVDSSGALVERYLYRDVRENPSELASSAAFRPEKRWGESNDFFSRIARAASAASLPGSSESTTR